MVTIRSLSIVLVSGLVWSNLAAAQQTQSGTADQNGTHLMLGPTARTLRQGQFSVDLSAIVGGPLVEVGFTNRVSMGVGAPLLIPGIRPGSAFVVTPKVRVFTAQKTDASVGVAHASGADGQQHGFAYGVVTRGSRDAAVTGGLGFTYAGDHGENRHAVGMLSGEKRVSTGHKVIAEGFMGRDGGVLSVGARAMRGHVSVDYGLATFFADGQSFAAPVFRIAWSR